MAILLVVTAPWRPLAWSALKALLPSHRAAHVCRQRMRARLRVSSRHNAGCLHASLQAAKEASAIPQGMRVLPEEERQEMLALLAQSRAEEEEKLLVKAITTSCCRLSLSAKLADTHPTPQHGQQDLFPCMPMCSKAACEP